MNIIQNLRKKIMILKPDKGQGIVLVNKDGYIRNIVCLFSDKTKFQVLDKDPTLHSINTVKNYLNTLSNRGEMSNEIQQIPKELFESGYKFVSLDLISLFTNVPLTKTTDIILKRVYSENLVTTNLTKRTMKKLLNNACSKTAFTFKDKIYKQTDCVSMASPLGPLLANIFMAELEKDVTQKLIDKKFIKFYIRYVDDALLLATDEGIDPILKELNSYNRILNLQLTDL